VPNGHLARRRRARHREHGPGAVREILRREFEAPPGPFTIRRAVKTLTAAVDRWCVRIGPLVVALCASLALASMSSGGTEQAPPRPTVYRVAPKMSCQRITVYTANGKRIALAPPSPGLTAKALSPRRIRLHWWFTKLPEACRPMALALGIEAYKRGLPVVVHTPRRGLSGYRVLRYYDFYKPPDVALASSYTRPDGLRSTVGMILVRH
jgi:hypothetical protein